MSTNAHQVSPVRFGRHVVAVFGAAAIVATLFGLFVGAAAVSAKGGGPFAAMAAGTAWLGLFILAVPIAGVVFTLAFPIMRHAGLLGWPVAMTLGVLGEFGATWAAYTRIGKTYPPGELGEAVLFGLILGSAYWWIARRG